MQEISAQNLTLKGAASLTAQKFTGKLTFMLLISRRSSLDLVS